VSPSATSPRDRRLGRPRQEGHELQGSLGCIVRPCLKQKQKQFSCHLTEIVPLSDLSEGQLPAPESPEVSDSAVTPAIVSYWPEDGLSVVGFACAQCLPRTLGRRELKWAGPAGQSCSREATENVGFEGCIGVCQDVGTKAQKLRQWFWNLGGGGVVIRARTGLGANVYSGWSLSLSCPLEPCPGWPIAEEAM
jgi:hypothetical protein